MDILVSSFDFDGCLYHSKYMKSTDKDVVKHNKALFLNISESMANYNKHIVFVGSLRQCALTNKHKMQNGTECNCFKDIQIITSYFSKKSPSLFENRLDNLLVTDLYNDVEVGTTFNNAIDHALPKSLISIVDQSKITILYAQIHKIASENRRQDNIVFKFYDNDVKILTQLKSFFETNSDLIPKNVTLMLLEYSGFTTSKVLEIKGSGQADLYYGATVRHIASMSYIYTSESSENLLKMIVPIKTLNSSSIHVSRYYKHYVDDTNPGRRYHFFKAKKLNTLLEGDALKSKILSDFRQQLDSCDSSKTLDQKINSIMLSEDYAILSSGQGFFSKANCCLKTTSVKAFESMCSYYQFLNRLYESRAPAVKVRNGM